MLHQTRNRTAVLLTSAMLLVGGCGGHSNQNYSNGSYDSAAPAASAPTPASPAPYDTTAQTNAPVQGKHHSVLGGAAAGAVAGHYMGHHALLGAAAGALIQHHRNKKAGY